MSSDAKDAKACYTKAGVRAAPIKYGVFLFLLFGGSSECSAQGNTEYLIGAARPPSQNIPHNTKEPIRHFFRTGSSLDLHSTKYSLVTF